MMHTMHSSQRFRFAIYALLIFVGSFGSLNAQAVTYVGYAGTTTNDGTQMDGLAGAPFPDDLVVNTLNGNIRYKMPQMSISGRGLPTEIGLTYNTHSAQLGSVFGLGWSFTYGIRLIVHVGGDVTVIWGDNRIDRFQFNGSNLIAPPGVFHTLSEYLPGQYSLTTTNQLVYFFESNLRLTRMQDPVNNELVFGYNGSNLLTTITDASGRVTTLTYNLSDRLMSITDPAARVCSFSYSGNRLATFTDTLGFTTSYTYDVLNRMTSITDARSNTTIINYLNNTDFSGGTVSRGSTTWTFQKVAATNGYRVTDALGRVTDYQYDGNGRVTTVVDALGSSMTYAYDSSNNVTQSTDENGTINQITYDANGNVLTKTAAVGSPVQRTTTFTYDATYNFVTSITRATGTTDEQVTTFSYDANGNRTSSAVDPAGLNLSTLHTYDVVGQRDSTTDPRGTLSTFTHDTDGNRTSNRLDPLGLNLVDNYTYDGISRMLTSQDRNGNVTTDTWDARDQMLTSTDALAGVTIYTYDSVRNRLSHSDKNANVSTYTYDNFDRVNLITDAVSNTTQTVFDAVGNLAQIIDANGVITNMFYDPLDRKVFTLEDFGGINAASTTTYDAVGNVLAMTDPNVNTSTFTYDALYRVSTSANALAETTTRTYDRRDNVKSKTQPDGNVITSIHDKADRVIAMSDSIGSIGSINYDENSNAVNISDGLSNTTTGTYDLADRCEDCEDALGQSSIRTFDSSGNVTAQMDRNGNTTNYTYDALHRRVTTKNALNNMVTNTYDAVGNVLTKQDPNGNVTNYTYDDINRLITETDADTKTRSLTYDGVDNILTRNDNNGDITTYTYDNLYRLTLRDFPDSNDDTFTYDNGGRMLTSANNGAAITHTYDPANRLISETLNGETTTYEYDIPARVRVVVYPGGEAVGESRDQRQRLIGVARNSLLSFNIFTYDLANRRTNATFDNLTSVAYTYNANDWMTKIVHGFSIDVIADFDYGYDDEGNRNFQKKNHRLGNSEQFLYDNVYRVTGVKEGTLDGMNNVPAANPDIQFEYDAVGNRITRQSNSFLQTYTTNNTNEYSTVEFGAITRNRLHDSNGNVIDTGSICIYYDFENRMIQTNAGSGSCPTTPPAVGIATKYTYDASRRRIQKQVDTTGDGVLDETTRYFYDGQRVIEEQDGSGITTANYIYGSGIDEVLSMDRGGNYYTYHYNSLGSVIALTDLGGTVVERYEYDDEFGFPQTLDAGFNSLGFGSLIGNPYLFTGRRWEPMLQMYFYRTRYYIPRIGRFTSRDTVGNWFDTSNLGNGYGYVGNNAVNGIDPYGMELVIGEENRDELFALVEKLHPGVTMDKTSGKVTIATGFKSTGDSHDLLKYIIESDKTVSIVATNGSTSAGGNTIGGKYSAGTDSTVNFNLNKSYRATEWDHEKKNYRKRIIPDFIVLAHELIHSTHHITGSTEKYYKDEEKSTVDPRWRSKKIVPGDSQFPYWVSENSIRKQFGICLRAGYTFAETMEDRRNGEKRFRIPSLKPKHPAHPPVIDQTTGNVIRN